MSKGGKGCSNEQALNNIETSKRVSEDLERCIIITFLLYFKIYVANKGL